MDILNLQLSGASGPMHIAYQYSQLNGKSDIGFKLCCIALLFNLLYSAISVLPQRCISSISRQGRFIKGRH